jgi:hypothetical protein
LKARKRATKISIRRAITIQLVILCAAASWLSVQTLYAQTRLQSGDGYIRREGNEWIFGTSTVERRVRLDDGRLYLVSLRNKLTGHEYQDAGTWPAEIRFSIDSADVSASSWRWKLRGEHAAQGSQGTLQLDIELESASIRVTKHYVVYPQTSVIREWLTLENISGKIMRVNNVDFFHTRLLGSIAQHLEFNYLTGGGNYNGSQLLKTEPMGPRYQRTLDSNGGVQPGNYSSYLPLVFLLNRNAAEGIAVGWDYLGHWSFRLARHEPGIDRFHQGLSSR